MKSAPRIAIAVILGTVSTMAARAADIPLYPTGPAEDSSFVRFFNVTDGPISLKASGGKTTLALTLAKPDSGFLPVAAGKPVKGQLVRGSQQADIDVTVKPGEFATVLGLSSATGALTTQVVRESPDDFNALKASLAFYNIAPDCKQAGLQAAGRNVAIFSDVPAGQAKRRLINPVSMSVQLMCAGKASGAPLSIGMLVAGERYSVFASPSAKGPHLSVATDTVVH